MSLTSKTSPPLPVCTAETRTWEIGGEYRSALTNDEPHWLPCPIQGAPNGQPVRCLLYRILLDVGHDDVGTGFGKGRGDAEADARGGAGDDGCLA